MSGYDQVHQWDAAQDAEDAANAPAPASNSNEQQALFDLMQSAVGVPGETTIGVAPMSPMPPTPSGQQQNELFEMMQNQVGRPGETTIGVEPMSPMTPASSGQVNQFDPMAQAPTQNNESEHIEFFHDEGVIGDTGSTPGSANSVSNSTGMSTADASRNESRDFVRNLLVGDDEEDDLKFETFVDESGRSLPKNRVSVTRGGGYNDYDHYSASNTKFHVDGSDRSAVRNPVGVARGGGYNDYPSTPNRYAKFNPNGSEFGSERSPVQARPTGRSTSWRMEDYDLDLDRQKEAHTAATRSKYKKWCAVGAVIVVIIALAAGLSGGGGGGESTSNAGSANRTPPSNPDVAMPPGSDFDVTNPPNGTTFTDAPTPIEDGATGGGDHSGMEDTPSPTAATPSPTFSPQITVGTPAPTLPPVTPEEQARLDDVTSVAEQALQRSIDWNDPTTPASLKNALHFIAVDDVSQMSLTDIDLPQKLALVAFFFATNPCGANPCGDRWVQYDNWLSEQSYCMWHGVVCDGSDVVELDLSNNGLKGHLPSELVLLTALTKLNLSTNNLFAPLPTNLGRFSHLQELQLNSNIMVGSIPPSTYTMSNLQVLHLNDNMLSGNLSGQMLQMSSLQELHLHGNQFNGPLPTVWGNLPNLNRVMLQNNQFTGDIPTSLAQASSLTHVSLETNSFGGSVPADMCALTLTHLSVDCAVTCDCCTSCV